MPKALLCVSLMAFTACAKADAVRLAAGRADTGIVNSRESVPLNLRLVDAEGVMRDAKNAQFRLVRGAEVELSNDGYVKCSRSGDAEDVAVQGDLSLNVTILCRPIVSFRMPRPMRLRAGDPPTAIDVGAIGMDGDSIDEIAGKMSVGDSQVATLVDGQIQPKTRGRTTVEVEAGDCVVSIPVEVFEWSPKSEDLLPHQYYAESISVAAGEIRNWRLPPGRYEISMFGAIGAPQHLRFASHQMNCAAFPGTEQQFLCTAKERASVVVQHTKPAGRGREAKATLLVHRMGSLSTRSAGHRALRVYPCPLVPR